MENTNPNEENQTPSPTLLNRTTNTIKEEGKSILVETMSSVIQGLIIKLVIVSVIGYGIYYYVNNAVDIVKEVATEYVVEKKEATAKYISDKKTNIKEGIDKKIENSNNYLENKKTSIVDFVNDKKDNLMNKEVKETVTYTEDNKITKEEIDKINEEESKKIIDLKLIKNENKTEVKVEVSPLFKKEVIDLKNKVLNKNTPEEIKDNIQYIEKIEEEKDITNNKTEEKESLLKKGLNLWKNKTEEKVVE